MSSFESLIAELSTSVGQGIYDSVRSNIIHEDQHYGPENKKDCPCDTCPMFDTCKVDMTECSAMRNWCSTRKPRRRLKLSTGTSQMSNV